MKDRSDWKIIDNTKITLLAWEDRGILHQAMSETIQFTEGETIIEKPNNIADILSKYSLSISAPAVNDLHEWLRQYSYHQEEYLLMNFSTSA